MPDLPSGTVTFLFTDIEGSTRLWEQFPDAMRAALARHDTLLHTAIHQHNGHVVKGTGDGLHAVFADASEGLAAALACQQALQAETWQAPAVVRVRMGLHTGVAQERDGDYFGSCVNRAARLMAVGHGGQVLLSEVTHDLAMESLPEGCSLLDLGSHRLKDLQLPEHVYQLFAPELPSEFPPLRSLQAFANNLPVQLTSFIGREKETEEVKRLLGTTKLLTLTGSGGCGKTRLALQVAADRIEAYADGVWLVELAALSEPAFVPQQVATALGLREEPGRTLTQTVTDYLLSKSVLLVLDNCEHLLPACANLSDTLLKACPNLHILATSREGLGILGEQVYRVPSLLAPDPQQLPGGERARVGEYDSVRLFVERARLQRLEFALAAENASAVAAICHRLDGIPLAIELAAARVKVLTVGEIDTGLSDRFALLTGGSKTALPRQRTLRAMMEWSYDLLSEQERLLLCRLSVFVGGWTLETARAVCAGGEIEDWQVLDVLTGLVDKSLVVVETQAGCNRYRLLETIRQYGMERLAQGAEAAEMRSRHLDFFLAMAEEAEPQLTGSEQGEWLERLETEHDNLRAALDWCPSEKDGVEAGLRLAGALWRFWEVRGYLGMGREYLGEALEREGAARRTALRAKVLNGVGNMVCDQGDYSSARALFEESLSISRELGDKRGIAASLHNLGKVAKYQDDFSAARALHEESLSIRQEIGDRWGVATSLHNLGNVACNQSAYADSRVYHEQSLAIKREIGDRRGIAVSLNSLGWVAYEQGEYADSRAYYEQSLSIQQEIGDRSGMALSLNGLGMVACEQGDYASSRTYHEQSLAIKRELGNKHGIAISLWALGNVACYQSEYADSRAYYEQSLVIAREIGTQGGIVMALTGLGNVACYQSEYADSRAYHEQCLALNREIGDPVGIVISLNGLGIVAQQQGDYASSRAYYEQSLAIAREIGNQWRIAYALEFIASLSAAEAGRNSESSRLSLERAACLWGAAEALRETSSSQLSANEREECDRKIEQARSTLGEKAFVAAWEQGRTMTIEQAIEFALEEPRHA